MNINYLALDNLVIRNNDFWLTPVGLFDSDVDVVTNDLFTDGVSYNRGKIKEKKILIKGYIKRDVLNNLLLLRKTLFKRGLKKLTVGLDTMTIYTNIEIVNFASDELNPHMISFQVMAPDPYLYELNAQNISLGAISGTTLKYPITTYPVSYGVVTGASGVVINYGNAMSYAVVTIIGTCSNFVVSNTTTGESMTINIALLGTDILVIDSRPNTRGIYLNGIKRMDLKSGSWISCLPGENNFTFSRNSLESIKHCSISLEGRWI